MNKLIFFIVLLVIYSCKRPIEGGNYIVEPKIGDYYGIRGIDVMELDPARNSVRTNKSYFQVYKIDTIIQDEIYFQTSQLIYENKSAIYSIKYLDNIAFQRNVRPVRKIVDLKSMVDNNEILFIRRE